jgi:hypothetical protein
VNRWIERIQEYDFSIQYIKGELMGDADALSRQYQDEDDKGLTEIESSKQMQGKIKKHTVLLNEKEY